MKRIFSLFLALLLPFGSVFAGDAFNGEKISVSSLDSIESVVTIKDFQTAVAMFEQSGYSIVDKFGVNRVIETTTDPEDVWEFGGLYQYDTFGTAPIQYISSSSALDTGQELSVQGLDINGDLVEQTATTNGQTNVTLTTPLWRVFRVENNADAGGEVNGVIYCHTDPTPTNGVPASTAVRAIVSVFNTNPNNQTLMALYTIPRGKVGFLYRGEAGVALEGNVASLSEYAILQYQSRRLGKLFKVKKEITLMVGGGSALYQDPRTFPDIIPDLTDIKLTATLVTATLGMWGAFDIMLVDESEFSPDFLAAIGQSGY